MRERRVGGEAGRGRDVQTEQVSVWKGPELKEAVNCQGRRRDGKKKHSLTHTMGSNANTMSWCASKGKKKKARKKGVKRGDEKESEHIVDESVAPGSSLPVCIRQSCGHRINR